MLERLGIVEDLTDRREAMMARLSPGARHRHFPTVYAKPLPRPDKSEQHAAEVKALKAQIAAQRAEILQLRANNNALSEALAGTAPAESVDANGEFRPRPVSEVMVDFCAALNRYGFRVHDELWTIDHMRSQRRSRLLARPRQICMWVCLRVTGKSLPHIGQLFGGRDHTTVMHARNRAREWMQENPLLARVAQDVIDASRAAKGTGSQNERGTP